MLKNNRLSLRNCKKCYLFLMIFAFIMLITAISDKQQQILTDRLPWQITTLESGNTKVFGITLNQSTMKEALKNLQSFPETALFVHKDGRRNLEAYFSSISLDGLTAKMVLEYGVGDDIKDHLIEGSIKKEGTPSGAFKYTPNEQDMLDALDAPVISITYIPYAQFDEEIILQRFGIASKVIELNAHAKVLLFPQLGLSLTYDTEAKELLQYVSPINFDRLVSLATAAAEAKNSQNQ